MNIIRYCSRIKHLLTHAPAVYRTIDTLAFTIRKNWLESQILNCTESGITSTKYCDHDIIVSLTTYGARLGDVCYTIESLMQQTMKANKIVLWLYKEMMNKPLPMALIRQKERGLTINIIDKDLRSYKKLIPTLDLYPNDAIITVDDDLVYDFDILERMIYAYRQHPQCIHACRIHTMTFNKKGELRPYRKWDFCKVTSTPTRNFFTGGGGTLYPPHALHSEVMNQEVFMKICPTGDDIWFNAMARLNGTVIRKVATRSKMGQDYIDNPNFTDMGLCNINVFGEQRNDIQIKAVFEKYNIYSTLNESCPL